MKRNATLPRANYGDIRICPVCGKEFLPTEEWVYKRAGKRLCSYTCMRKYDKEHEALVAQHRKAGAALKKARRAEKEEYRW